METRKLQHGSGVYTISVPKEWAESQDLEAGETIALHAPDNGLLVVQPRDRTTTVRVEPAHDAERLELALRSAFRAGFDRVVLLAPDGFTAEQDQVVDRSTASLTGTTLSARSATHATVEILLDTSKVSVERLLDHLRYLALTRLESGVEGLLHGATSVDGSSRLEEAEGLYAMVERFLRTGRASPDAWIAAHALVRIADHADTLGTLANEADDRTTPGRDRDGFAGLSDDTETIARGIGGVVEDGVDVVIGEHDVETAARTFTASRQVRSDVTALDRRLFQTPGVSYELAQAVDRLRRTAERGVDLAEVGYRTAVRRADTTVVEAGYGADSGRGDTAEDDFSLGDAT